MIDGYRAHDEDGTVVPAEDFDWDAVEGEEPQPGLGQMSQDDIDRGLEVLGKLLSWIWQDGMKNPDGLKLRAIVVCWVFRKELRPMTMSQMARGFGLKKQSLGRWVVDFEKAFPRIRTPHMRCK